MKRLIFILIISLGIFKPTLSHAQVDSARISMRFGIQARDWVFITPYLNDDIFDMLRDSLNARFRGNAALTATSSTVVTLDSVERGAILRLFIITRELPFRYSSFLNRIDAQFNAITDPYVNNRMNAYVANIITDDITTRQAISIRRLKGIRQ